MKQMQAKTPMVFVMKDGETLEGVIEWYDKTCLKVNRDGHPNLLIFKPNIKYMYKAGNRATDARPTRFFASLLSHR